MIVTCKYSSVTIFVSELMELEMISRSKTASFGQKTYSILEVEASRGITDRIDGAQMAPPRGIKKIKSRESLAAIFSPSVLCGYGTLPPD